jgi:hypothetical protein
MTELATTGGQMDVMTLGQTLARSGYFSDVKDAAQAVVKVLAGRELGIGEIAAMTGIYIVKGRVTMSANIMASLIKRSGKYNYRVTKLDNDGVSITFFEQGQEIGVSSFTVEDAKLAGLWGSSDPWKRTPRNMMFARAMSNGAKFFCPDIFAGPIYTPDELNDQVDMPARYVDVATGEVSDSRTPVVEVITRRDVLINELREAYRKARSLNIPTTDLPGKKHIEQAGEEELAGILETVNEMIQINQEG